MNASAASQRITEGLNKLIAAGHRVVWWSDPEGEFQEHLDEVVLEGTELIDLSGQPALAVKRRVELDAPEQRYVLYEAGAAPEADEDWLLDLRLYAEPFAADATSMLLQDLGLKHASLRDHLRQRSRFFASKERTTRLAQLLEPDDFKREVDAKIFAVLARSNTWDTFSLIQALLSDVAKLDADEGIESAPLWQELDKYGLQPFAWALLRRSFGYSEEEPSLTRFVLQLFVTDLAHGLRCALPAALSKFQLPDAYASSVAVFLSQWRDSTTRHTLYDRLAERVAKELDVEAHLRGIRPADAGDCATFVALERAVALALRDLLLGNMASTVADEVRRVAYSRMEGYWANPRWPDTDSGARSIWYAYYRALIAATELFALVEAHGSRLSFDSAKAAYEAYAETLYEVDQRYRQFHESADKVAARSADAIRPLVDEVEAAYLNGFLSKLGQHWDAHLDNRLLATWSLDGIAKQQEFYQREVARYLKGGDDRRIFVIVSDALRYEVAQELKTTINGRDRIEATLNSQLGVLPSYTKLGMASLLPHKTLSYTAKGTVQADGKSTDGLDNRNRLLEKVDGLAIKAEELATMGKEALRERIKPYRVVYVYHNQIDAIGDNAATEEGTWSACRTTIRELTDLVARLVNSANASAITITADHGFLFRESPPEAIDKSALGTQPSGTIVAKKRYLVGTSLGESPAVHHGSTKVTAGTTCDTEFWLPRGLGRFHFVGGARFVHGGASLQEIVVPVINVRQTRGKRAERTSVRKTCASVLGHQHRITTAQHVFTLVQTEAVSERVLPCTIDVGLYDKDGEAVSTTSSVRLESERPELGERQHKVSLSLLAQAVRSGREYYLIVTDADTGVEYHRIEVRIDLAIENDFDF